MDVLMLSRLQFAVATFFHFIFVPLTLGLSVLVAIMETKFVRTGDEEYRRMARFWGKIFIINFAVGVVTGITLEFQFGTNWARYSKYVGDIFGSLLAIEATLAFFLESTFLAVWIFGWKRLSPKLHCVCIWLVAFAANLSALWILIANAWMQHPVGFVLRNGRAELSDFLAWSPACLQIFFHRQRGCPGGFLRHGVSAIIYEETKTAFFNKSFRIALSFALIFAVAEVVQGHIHGSEVAKIQPTKLAAMESLWETKADAPMYLFLIPDAKSERNLVEIGKIPGALSLLAYHSSRATVKGLKDFPKEDRPPVALTFVAFRLMVGLGFLFVLLTVVGWFKRRNLEASPGYLKIMLYAIPLPYIALQAGWIVTEVGRQPWIVYGLMRTKDAVSPIAGSQVAISLAAFILVYSTLGAIAFYLIGKQARRGPEPRAAAAGQGEG
jgi:cytochrome d ubiquinol oxidase subunit I